MHDPGAQFTLFGGRLTQLLPRTAEPLAERIEIAAAVAWAPLVVLGLLQGVAIGPTPRESVLADPAVYARFLIALPLLLQAPFWLDPVLHAILRHFLDSGFVRDADRPRFRAAIDAAVKARDSRLADIVCLALAYSYPVVLVLAYRATFASEVGDTWHSLGSGAERKITFAGWWNLAVSQPLYLFVLFRFLYRIGLLWVLLFRISTLPLRLNSLHPDQCAGLGFVRLYLRPLRIPAFAIAISAAGGLANLTLWTNVDVTHHKYAVALLVALIVAAFAGPLTFFAIQIRRAREAGILLHGALVARQLDQFEKKWPADAVSRRNMLGVQDFSALVDFNSVIAAAQKTKGLLVRFDTLIVGLFAMAPFLIVAALNLPIAQILSQLIQILR
jgi:hypothetical protein